MSSAVDTLVGSLTGYITAVAIPLVAIVGGLSYAAYSAYLRVRRQREMLQMHHAERMAAIEKGIELPPLPPELLYDRYYGDGYRCRRGRGVTLLLIGVAVTIAMWQVNGDRSFWWGLIIVAAGLGRMLSDYLQAPGVPPRGGNDAPPPRGFNR